MIIQTRVSAEVHYGVRLWGTTPGGTAFNAWQENSVLQHRPGLGTPENISADLRLEAYLANDQVVPSNSLITRISFYVEATPGTEGQFSMKVTSLDAFTQEQTTSTTREISGSFLDIAINLDLPSTDLSLFQAFVSFDIRGTPDLQYTPFLVSGAAILAQGFTYVQTGTTSHQNAVLLPQLAVALPPLLPSYNSTQIILGSKSGQINYFHLNGLTFKYTSTPLQTQGLVDSGLANFMAGYYILFLFVTPIAAVILLTKVFKSEK